MSKSKARGIGTYPAIIGSRWSFRLDQAPPAPGPSIGLLDRTWYKQVGTGVDHQGTKAAREAKV